MVKESGEVYEIREYLKNPPTREELRNVLQMLGLEPQDLLRKRESIFKDNYRGKEYTVEQWIEILVENPILIERPIVVRDSKAVIGRPIGKVVDLLHA